MYPKNVSLSAFIVAFEDEKKNFKINFSTFLENCVKLTKIIFKEV